MKRTFNTEDSVLYGCLRAKKGNSKPEPPQAWHVQQSALKISLSPVETVLQTRQHH